MPQVYAHLGFWVRIERTLSDYLLPPEIRQKASVTDHLRKGSSRFRRIKGSAAPV